MAEYRERVAERIVQSREREGLSREALALKSGVSVKQLKRIEASLSDPRLSTVRKLADALGVTVTDLRPDLAAEERFLRDQLDRIEAKLDQALAQVGATRVRGAVRAAGQATRKPAAESPPGRQAKGKGSQRGS